MPSLSPADTATITTSRPADPPRPGAAPLLAVAGAGIHVPLATGGTARHVHLDYAASAPALASVVDAVTEFVPWYGSVHRGAGFLSTVSSELLESARGDVGRFVGARADDLVIFTRNTTDALSLLAAAIPDDVVVLTLDAEHHANLLPWRARRVVHLPTPSRADDVAATFEQALRAHGGRALVSITGASNVTGELVPLAEVAAVAHRHGARVAVDAAQLAPHRGIDIAALGVDYVALSGHKLYAPFGAGVLVGRADWLDAAPPYLPGGGATVAVGLDRVAWATGSARHEGGTPNVVGVVALAAACRALLDVGLDAVAAHDRAVTGALLAELAVIDGVETLAAFGASSARVGIASVAVAEPAAVAAALSAEHGISTRDGAFCAHPLLRRLRGVADGHPVPNALRASVGVGSTLDDVSAFAAALRTILDRGPAWRYAEVDGRLVPSPDPRRRPVG